MIRVVIVDDHEAVRHGLRAIVSAQDDMKVSAEASNGEDALECVRSLRPSIVLMDVSMPGWSGLTTTRKVIEAYPDTRIIALSRYDDPSVVRGMLDAGATGYVLKQHAARELINAIRAVAAGQQIPDSTIPDSTIRPTPDHSVDLGSGESCEDDPGGVLTEREQRVLLLIATASSNEQIARLLSISADDATLLKHQAMRKAGLASRIQVMGYAQRRGWID